MSLRKPFIVFGNLLLLIGWEGLDAFPWSPGLSGMLLYFLVGLSPSQVVITFAVVKEVVSLSMSGMALAFLNTGVFLEVSLLQPLFGWIMDISWSGSVVPQYSLNDYGYGLLFYESISFMGLFQVVMVTRQWWKYVIGSAHQEGTGDLLDAWSHGRDCLLHPANRGMA